MGLFNRKKLYFDDYHQKYDLIVSKKSKLLDELNNARIKSGCVTCPIGKEEVMMPLENMYTKCRDDKSCMLVVDIFRQIMQIKAQERACVDEYAHAIFDSYYISNPKLRNDITGERTDWTTVFGIDYTQLTLIQKVSIVALIEEDGGQYRFD